MHGLQLWVALPDARRHVTPSFEHYVELPVTTIGAARAVVLIGELNEACSPTKAYSRMVGADVVVANDGDVDLPLDPSFEHALLLIEGSVALGDRTLEPSNGGFSSRERLDHERQVFFGTPFSLGQRRLRQEVQTEPLCLGVSGFVPCVQLFGKASGLE